MPIVSPELEAALAAARADPAGTLVVVDESALLDGSTAAVFAGEAIRAGRPSWRALPAEVALVSGIGGDENAAQRLAAGWTGTDAGELATRARRLFVDEIAPVVRPEMWALVAEHRRCGHRVVITGSGTDVALRPLADELGVDDLVATEVEFRDGCATGRLVGPVRRGVVARDALPAGAVGVAYAGTADAAPLLAAADRSVVVGPDLAARTMAGERGWPVLDTEARGTTPGDLGRAVAMYSGLFGTAGLGAVVGLLRGSRRPMVDLVCGVGGDLGLALAGIDLEVTGAEHLWSSRPCVFVFNHQSKLDVVLLLAILRHRFTGVAKEEARDIPGWGAMFALAEVAFVRRGDPAKAVEALEPAVAKIREEGWSLAIAPEGTRSATPRLGRFKKGAFHIAMQAGVPMVPIVLHDAGERMSRGAQTLRSGTVHAEVLAPVDTSGWRIATLTRHVADVRRMFTHALGETS